jgi:hypothetical protein
VGPATRVSVDGTAPVRQAGAGVVTAPPLPPDSPQTYVRGVGGDWRSGFEYAWQAPDPEPDEGPGLTWRQLTPRHWSGTWGTKIRGTITRDGDGWVAYLRLEDPPGLSPITTVGRYDTVDEAQVATDEAWAAHRP